MSTTDDNKPEKDPDVDLSEVQNVEDSAAQKPPPVPVTEMSLDAALSEQANTRTPLDEKKKKQIMYGAGALVFAVLVIGLFSCQPAKGSLAYGICSTFLELNTPYPHTLQHTELEGSMTAVRIYFTSTDPFGEFRQEMIECTFGPDETMGMKLSQVARNRRPVDPKLVRDFNITLPTIMASDPYLVLPPEWKNPLLPD